MTVLSKLKSALFASAFCISTFASSHALADAATAESFTAYATGGGLETGVTDFAKRAAADADNGEAIFGLGALQFLHALEGLQQDLYRYGAGNRVNSRAMAAFLPVLRVPVPPNPNAETASYEKVRAILEKFVARMEKADKTLSQVSDKPAKLPLNITKIAFDIDADGKNSRGEDISAILAALGRRRGGTDLSKAQFEIAFDTADAHWLRGYANVLMSVGNFFLSFDFEKSYDASFHVVFGREATKFGRSLGNAQGDADEIEVLQRELDAAVKAKDAAFSPQQRKRLNELRAQRRELAKTAKPKIDERNTEVLAKADAAKRELERIKPEMDSLRQLQRESSKLVRAERDLQRRLARLDPASGTGGGTMEAFFDPVGFLHSISWDVIDSDRLKAVRQNLRTVMKLNRTTWRLAQEETDNDREWLPNPNQEGPFPGLEVTQGVIDSWLKTVEAGEAMLEGKLLAPHMRFGRGVNMKRFFEEAKSFDLVLFLTGPNSIEFVERGPIADARLMQTLRGPMGRNFNAYALWFN